jgi:hypothetical protein
MSSGSRDRLPDREGSGAAMCTVAPNSLRGLQSVMYPMAPDPTSLLGGGGSGLPCVQQSPMGRWPKA